MVDAAANARLTPAMISEIDIQRTALIMIKQYGDAADFEACLRADALSAKGDSAGMRVWLRILDAIDRLQNVQPGETRQ